MRRIGAEWSLDRAPTKMALVSTLEVLGRKCCDRTYSKKKKNLAKIQRCKKVDEKFLISAGLKTHFCGGEL